MIMIFITSKILIICIGDGKNVVFFKFYFLKLTLFIIILFIGNDLLRIRGFCV